MTNFQDTFNRSNAASSGASWANVDFKLPKNIDRIDQVVDRIDQLVDEQLAGGEPRTGFDFGDPQFPNCPHCDRKWHGIAITERVAQMYDLGHYDNDYRVDADESPVLCRGSDFIGPMPSMVPSYVNLVQFTDYLGEVLFGGSAIQEAMQELPVILRPLEEFARTIQLQPRPSPDFVAYTETGRSYCYYLGMREGAPYYSDFIPEGFTEIGTIEE